MIRPKNVVYGVAGLFAATLLIGGFAAGPAIAQVVRAALVRDTDNPALAPFRDRISLSLAANEGNKAVNGPVVPLGKRLVLENVSVWIFNHPSDPPTGIWLAAAGVNPPTFALMDPTSIESKVVNSGSSITAYNRVVRLYFNPGETVQAQVFFDGTTSTKQVNIYLNGYYVTLP